MNEEENKRLGEALISLGQGNAASLQDIALIMQRILYAIGNAYFTNRADVEDAVQELYVLLHRKAKAFHRNDNAKAWIVRVFKNFLTSKKRRAKRETEILSEYSRARINAATADEKYIENHLLLQEIIAHLSKTEWEIFIYNRWCGYTVREIAKIVNKSKGSVEYQLNKIEEKIKNMH